MHKNIKKAITKMKELVDSSESIAIFGHDNPDGDAVWSMLWLGKMMENMGKLVNYFATPLPSRLLDIAPGVEKIQDKFDETADVDLVIFVDFSPYYRSSLADFYQDYCNTRPLVIIDHHIGPTPEHALVLKDEDADSNCEWIFELTRDIWKQYYDKEVATCLYMGLLTDTANFYHDRHWSRSLRNGADLVDLWVDKRKLTQKLFWTLQLGQLEFFAYIVKRLQIQDKIGFVAYQEADYKQFNLEADEASMIVLSLLGKLEELDLLLIGKEQEDNTLKISIRSSNPSRSAEQVAKNLGGGWHFYAAGAKIDLLNKTAQQALQDVVDTILDS